MAYFTDTSSLDSERKICSDLLQLHGFFSTSYAPPNCGFRLVEFCLSYFAGHPRNSLKAVQFDAAL